MRTLARQCFERDWIQEQSRLNHLGDIVLEKCLYAFELLGRLTEARLNFVFKGGTSLILRLQNLRRISIDIDIVCDEPTGVCLPQWALFPPDMAEPFFGVPPERKFISYPEP